MEASSSTDRPGDSNSRRSGSAEAESQFAVEFEAVSKRFGAVRANDEVSFCVRPGTIHAIIGENGAGKSTSMKMLYGMDAPDSGRIKVFGREVKFSSPRQAIAAGIGMVHQHFMLAMPFPVWENIVLGEEEVPWFGVLPKSRVLKKLNALAETYGLIADWETPVEELPVGIQQRVEILKLLYRDSKILILDEPTAVLTPQEVQDLLVQLKRLREEGKTVLIITHKLKEILQIADEATVLRGGRVVSRFNLNERRVGIAEIAESMVGRPVDLEGSYERKARGEVALRAEALEFRMLKNFSLEVCAGEILGIVGVEGNGQSDLLEALLLGKRHQRAVKGRIEMLGRTVFCSSSIEKSKTPVAMSAAEILDLGVGWIPEDRHRDGVLLSQSMRENVLLGYQRGKFSKNGWLRLQSLRRESQEVIHAFDVRPDDPEWIVGQMSGGNQQKLVVGREFMRNPRLLVAAQPTRGVDVGAIEFIHQKLIDARNQGVGVLLVSSELDEVFKLADRLVVIYSGNHVGELKREEFDEKRVGRAMAGGSLGS